MLPLESAPTPHFLGTDCRPMFYLFTTEIHHNLSPTRQLSCSPDSEIRDYIQERVKDDIAY